MSGMKLTFKGVSKALENLAAKNAKFLTAVAKNWSTGANTLVSDIVRTQYSGRPALNRKSGNLARLIQTTTAIEGDNVITRFFINSSNPARIYWKTHDKVQRRRTIRATGGGFMTFKLPNGEWRKVKKVYIPARTNVIGALNKGGKRLRIQGVAQALKVYR